VTFEGRCIAESRLEEEEEEEEEKQTNKQTNKQTLGLQLMRLYIQF
jgi:hypothetical protein